MVCLLNVLLNFSSNSIHCQIMDDFERNEAERRKFLNSARLKKVDRFLTQSGMRKEQVGLNTI